VPEASEESAIDAEPIRVVVVDDEELFRRGLVMLIGTEPDLTVVGEASSGSEAVEICAATSPDVVLLDVKMPHGSGIESCAAIKQSVPSAAIIMLTSSDEESDLYAAIKSGASGYLLKASSISEVGQAIRGAAAGQSLISPAMAAKLLEEFKQISAPVGRAPALPTLTERESQVLKAMSRGLTNREIGKELFISDNTVKNHVANILGKLQLRSRVEAILYAVRENLVDSP
jgi:DNA-binding NarL/FixJ family response regulator